jgi:dimethylaniline monooxygenase (N-oxide forming)
MANKKIKGIMNRSFGKIEDEWNLSPWPPIKVSPPVVSDTLIDHLRSKEVRSVSGLRRIKGPKTVELSDGEEMDIDSIICCTGYRNDFSILDGRYNPSIDPPKAWTRAPGSKGRPLPRLYQNVFSMEMPESLAFVGCVWFASGAFLIADIASMCIAQVWAGKSKLPPPQEMSRWMDKQTERMAGLAHRGTPVVASVPQSDWLRWANETAGAGLYERMGWGGKGWRFWWTDRELYKMVMDGVLTSASWRLFDEGKRKSWPQARDEIVRLNREAQGD